jgi:hypothetical protein
MPEPATSNDHIERANTQFWNPPSLEELMADVAPLEPNEHTAIRCRIPLVTHGRLAAELKSIAPPPQLRGRGPR